MKGIISSLIFLFCSLGAIAQTQFTVSGTLIEGNTKEIVEAASVSILNVKDSSIIIGGISNRNGVFSLKLNKKGNFLLNVSYIGYKPIYQPFAASNTATINLGTINLFEDALELGEAVVTGKKPEVIVKNDTIEYDATSYKTGENAVVEDLLKKLPGVEVDKDGKISVNGKEIKKFMVDGKEFFSDDPKVASKNLPAEMVEKLQVIDRKSDLSRMTGFDDGEEESIINITVRPGMKQGTMGNAMAGMGQDINVDKDLRYEAGAMINHMKNSDRYTLFISGNNTNNMGASDLGQSRFGGMRGMRRGMGGIIESGNIMADLNKEFSQKLSLNGNVMVNSRDQNSETDTRSIFLSNAFSQQDNTKSRNNDISDNYGLNFRLEWKPDSSNTIIFRPNISYNKSSSDQSQEFARIDYNTQETLFSGKSSSYNEGEGYNLGGSLEFSHKFSRPGRVFSAQLRTSYNDSYSYGYSNWEQKMFLNNGTTKDSIRNQRSENDNLSTNLRTYISYVEPLGNNNFAQIVYNGNFNNTESINSTYNIFENNSETEAAILYADQSRSTLRNSSTNQVGVRFKAVRPKYNYTVGVNFDPSNSTNKTYQPTEEQLIQQIISKSFDDRLPNIKGNSEISKIDQEVFNFSPMVNFNYLFGQRSNLRIDYEGETTQPTANQLRDYPDVSNPMNITVGNPNLKPGYSNQFSARFNKSIPETQMFYNFNLRANVSMNDIVAVTTFSETGERMTTYDNINGNWNAFLMGGFNTPLKNKKFTIGNFIRASVANRKSYSEVNKVSQENTQQSINFNDMFRLNFRCKLFDVGTNLNFGYAKVTNDIRPANNLETFDYGAGVNTTWYLPHNITFESDFNWTKRSGYAEGFNISEALWNTSVSKQLFSKKYGIGTLKLKIYDILQDRNNISGGNTTNGYTYSKSTTIPSFFMCSFIYRFTIFPKGSSASEKDVRQDRPWGGPGSGHGDGGGRGGRTGMF